MPRDLEDLLALLRELLTESFTIPLGTDKAVINKDKALALLDEIDSVMPTYVREAKRIAEEEVQIIAKAKRDAETTKKRAEEFARRKISEEEIVINARQKANDILAKADSQAKELHKSVYNYVENILKNAEDNVHKSLNDLKKTRTEFRQKSKK